MSAQSSIDSLLAKLGIPSSVGPDLIASVIQAVFDETRHSFAVVRTSVTPIVVSTDPDNASVLDSLVMVSPSTGFTLDDTLHAIENTTGEEILRTDGGFNLQVLKAGGGVSVVSVYSEIYDGAVWADNPNSLRVVEVPTNGEGVIPFPSFTGSWPAGYKVRFRIYASGTGTITIQTPTSAGKTDPVLGVSAYWSLARHS